MASPRFRFARIALFLCAVIVGSAVLILVGLRDKELADARRELMTLDAVLAEETARAMQSVDLVLKSVVEPLDAHLIDSGETFGRLLSGRDTHENLKAKIAGVPQLDAVTVIGADGRLINFSRSFPVPTIDLSDRDYFIHLHDTPITQSFVTEPVQNRASGTWTTYLARRVTGVEGRFLGLVLGAIDLRYFDGFYRSLGLAGQSAISLWRSDGTLLAREPPVPGVGNRFKIESFTPELQYGPAGFHEVRDAMDGLSRLVATRAVPGYPLVVNVTRTHGEVLQDWRTAAFLGAGATLVCVAALLLFLWALARQAQTDRARMEAVAERENAVAARESAEAQLRQSQKMEALGHLTGGIAHDFGNLLNVVLVNLDWIERKLDTDNTLLSRVRDAISGAERAAATTQKLLDFARKQPSLPVPVDVNALITDFTALLRTTLGGQVRLDLALSPGLPPLDVDPNELENAILNLAVNARDAMPKGGRLTIASRAVDSEAEGSRLAIEVSDTGTGMSDEVAARVFEPFFTTKPPGSGTGLGLTQVLGFVRNFGGTVSVQSAPGAGSTIRMAFPFSAPRASTQAAA